MASFIDPSKLDLEDNVVAINRITKVVKGGRRLRFAALVIVGDKKGHVGFGTGKAQEVPEAIRKAVEAAKKNLIEVPIVGTTLPHQVIGVYGGGRILLKPAVEGSGVAAGGAVRSVMELAGVADVTSKRLGSNTPVNVVRATFEGLKALKEDSLMAQVKITLIHSAAHRLPAQRAIVKALGLGKINSSVIKPDNEATRGAIFKVAHLVTIEEVK